MEIKSVRELESLVDLSSLTTGFIDSVTPRIVTFASSAETLRKALNNPNVYLVFSNVAESEYAEFEDKIIYCSNPRLMFVQFHNEYIKDDFNFTSEVDSTAQISKNAEIDSKGVRIGPDSVIEAFTTIKRGTKVDRNVFIGSGTKLGTDSLYESRSSSNELFLLSHLGSLQIEEGSHIAENCVIGRGIFKYDSTKIGSHNAIGPLTKICHGVKLGDYNFIGSGVVISGYTTLGESNFVGPNCSIANGLNIGDSNRIAMGTSVFKSISDNQVSLGNYRFERKGN